MTDNESDRHDDPIEEYYDTVYDNKIFNAEKVLREIESQIQHFRIQREALLHKRNLYKEYILKLTELKKIEYSLKCNSEVQL
tara:strand:- start:16 stop:261 length:246 start_codon:yes stop_codon:yes gene_type:complete